MATTTTPDPDDFSDLFSDLHTFVPEDLGDAAARRDARERKSDAAALAHVQASAWGADAEAAKLAARRAAEATA